MADMNSKSRKLPMNLSLFCSTETPAKSSIKSPKTFEEPNGVVGLGILAAMNSNNNDEYCSKDPSFKRTAILANSPRSLSNPIPILSKRKSSFSAKSDKNTTDTTMRTNVEEMELCEGYTCVISHIGEHQIKKKEYFDNGWFVGCSINTIFTRSEKISADSNSTGHRVSSGVVSASSAVSVSYGGETPSFPVADFLNSCFLCKKQLHGLDIYMYRGDKAFCSSECRGKQISIDEHTDKCVSGTMKPLEYSPSPCSSPMQFFAGVAAA